MMITSTIFIGFVAQILCGFCGGASGNYVQIPKFISDAPLLRVQPRYVFMRHDA